MTAARTGNVEAVAGAARARRQRQRRETTRGQTALMWAAGEGHAGVVQALLEAGADLNAQVEGARRRRR